MVIDVQTTNSPAAQGAPPIGLARQKAPAPRDLAPKRAPPAPEPLSRPEIETLLLLRTKSTLDSGNANAREIQSVTGLGPEETAAALRYLLAQDCCRAVATSGGEARYFITNAGRTRLMREHQRRSPSHAAHDPRGQARSESR